MARAKGKGRLTGARLLLTLDRVEEDSAGQRRAVLVADDGGQGIVPLQWLPTGCGEGDCLTISIEVDVERTAKRMGAIRSLQEEVFGSQPG